MEEQKTLTEDQLSKMVVDLGVARKEKLNESWLGMFGSWVKWILRGMFGGPVPDVKISGTKSEVESFMNVLAKEKDYMRLAQDHGLSDARTYKNKFKLEKAANTFFRKTGIKWPFK
jgi:hypothetical protein